MPMKSGVEVGVPNGDRPVTTCKYTDVTENNTAATVTTVTTDAPLVHVGTRRKPFVRVPLTRGLFALVDKADLHLLVGPKWHASTDGDGRRTYARAHKPGSGHVYKPIWMHRIILDAPDGVKVDHINGDGLDNRRANLRLCTNAQNSYNSRLVRKGNDTGLKGVSRARRGWFARITVNYKQIDLGVFPSSKLAALAYDAAARQHFGEFARCNFPQPSTPNQHKESHV